MPHFAAEQGALSAMSGIAKNTPYAQHWRGI